MHLGAYEVTGELGRGGMGTVYRARAPDGRDVAIKVLLPQAIESGLARFARERRLLEELGSDAGFVGLLDQGEGPGGPFVVMPFVSGGTLRERLARGPLGQEETLRLGRSLAAAIGRAHAKGIIHRDLKPENILFTAEERPLIADLGLAKHLARGEGTQSVALSRTGELRGTLCYMAPEQCRDAKTAGPPADVFALGAILHECLTGEPVFSGSSLQEVLGAIFDRPAPSLRALRKDTPGWLVSIIARALAKDAAARFPDGAALARALEAGSAGGARPATLAAAVLVVAAASAAALGLAPRPGPSPQPAPSPVPTPLAVRDRAPEEKPAAAQPPAWFLALPRWAKPSVPLPPGVRFGDGAGEFVAEKDGSVLLYVSPGSFDMGTTSAGGDLRPVHAVELSGFFIGKREVTREQLAAFVAATGHVTTAEAKGSGYRRTESPGGRTIYSDQGELVTGLTWRRPGPEAAFMASGTPALQVSWGDAQAYCRWVGLRLPTEAEWERTAAWDVRTVRSRRHPWGDEPEWTKRRVLNAADRCFLAAVSGVPGDDGFDDGFALVAPVGSFPDGASPVGALDLLGNAAEWCQDVYDETFYAVAPRKDPVREATAGDTSSQRVTRGGSFRNEASALSTWRRGAQTGEYRADDLGFRVARAGR